MVGAAGSSPWPAMWMEPAPSHWRGEGVPGTGTQVAPSFTGDSEEMELMRRK